MIEARPREASRGRTDGCHQTAQYQVKHQSIALPQSASSSETEVIERGSDRDDRVVVSSRLVLRVACRKYCDMSAKPADRSMTAWHSGTALVSY